MSPKLITDAGDLIPRLSSRTPRSLANPRVWLAAQAGTLRAMAQASRSIGRLEATLAALSASEANGARQRLALLEVEAMLWAQGLVIGRDEIGRDLLDARAGSDPEAIRLARWAIRRLEGQGGLTDLSSFLGLHRRTTSDEVFDTGMELRPQGVEFDAAASEFLETISTFGELHPLLRGPAVLAMWRMAELSPPGQVVEPAVWSARHMAAGAEGLLFIPLGRHGRRVWTGFGSPEDRLAAHLIAVHEGAQEARTLILGICAWCEQARAATAGIKGSNAARVVAVLASRPLISAMELEVQAAISRPTAERMLKRLTDLGLTREVTGHRRFRLWTIAGRR